MYGIAVPCFRLSKVASAQIRDNNPNIVDLNDPFRPTKMAELFSELYDNEWTTAYSAIENELSGVQIVSFLLDMVMVGIGVVYWYKTSV